jgi:DNA-binding NarL/FixJ family response regulator
MSKTPFIRILLAEDHAVVREGLVAILNREPDMSVIAEAENGQQAINLHQQHQPDLTLMDLRMPVLGGVEAIVQILAKSPTAQIIVLTTYDGDEDIYRGLKAGATGYLLKDATAEELLGAIRVVHQGRKYIPPELALKLVERMNDSVLTDREVQVLQLLAMGNSSQAISAALTITEGTVKFHINNILYKLQVSDRTQAVVTALKRGLVHLN